jgi:outer membrane protein assembly factor BamB
MRYTVIALSLLFVAADWPQFRGPTGQGLSDAKHPPTEWGPDKNVAWKVPIPGKGWSSPVVAGGRIYLTTAVPRGTGRKADQSLRALCLDAKTGKTLWDKEVFRQDGKTAPAINNENSHASATPAVAGDRLVAYFGHQGIACLDTRDGSVLWSNRTLKYIPIHGNGGSPAVFGGKIFVCMDGPDRREVVAFDLDTGKVAWQFKRPQRAKRAFSFSTPLVIEMAGRPMVVAPGSGVVNALDPDTGKELWAVTYNGYSVVPRPVFGHGMVFLSTGYDRASVLAIKIEPKGDGFAAKVAWRADRGAPLDASPLLVGDELYLSADGLASCLDARTGKVHWSERVPGQYWASPVYAGGHVYLQNKVGVGTVLKAGTTFDVVATNKLEPRTFASYAVDGDALLIRTEKHLYRVGR